MDLHVVSDGRPLTENRKSLNIYFCWLRPISINTVSLISNDERDNPPIIKVLTFCVDHYL